MYTSARDDKKKKRRREKESCRGEEKKQGSSHRAGVFLYQLVALQSGVPDYERSLREPRGPVELSIKPYSQWTN
jgi:hypothetical protein